MNLFLLTLNVIPLVRLHSHMLSGRLMVHFIGQLSRLFPFSLLPSIVFIERAISALGQLSLVQPSELELGPGGHIVVFFDQENLKAIIGQLNAVLWACEVDWERKIDHLNVADLGYIDFKAELRI